MFIYIETCKEVWKNVYLNGIKSNYVVSSHGRIKNSLTNKILSPRNHSSGYKQISLYDNGNEYRFYVHRLVLMTFNYFEGCENFQVNHIDGNKTNNFLYNLEWCTNSENQLHAHKIGLKRYLYGDSKGRANFSNDEIIQICELMKNGYSNRYINEKFNIKDKNLLSDIRCKRRWVEVTKNYTFEKIEQKGENNPSAKYSENDIRIICESLSKGMKIVDIHKKYGFSKDVVGKIKRKRNWTHISKDYNF